MRRLILRPGAIGDCILAMPAMQHLVTDYTEIWIPAAVVPLVQFGTLVRPLSATGIDSVGFDDRPVPSGLAQALASFDSVVSWYGSNRLEFRKTVCAINPHCEFLQALPPSGYGDHATTYFCEQVGAPDSVPRLVLGANERRDSVVIHPFSGGKRKNWPLERYRELAARLPYPVEWTAGPEEELNEAARFDDLSELASWIAGSRLYIGNDSGITHLAAAAGARVLALFGATDPVRWAPRGENVGVLRHDPITELPVGHVLQQVHRLLNLSW